MQPLTNSSLDKHVEKINGPSGNGGDLSTSRVGQKKK